MLETFEIQKFHPFHILTSDVLGDLEAYINISSVPKGTMLFKRGKTLSDRYYLVDGEINLINNEFGVDSVLAGSDRAKVAFNDDSPTKVSAVAKTAVTYFTIDADVLERSLHETSRFEEDTGLEMGRGSSSLEVYQKSSDIVEEASSGEDWMTCLVHSPLFSQFPSSKLHNLFTRFERVFASAGEEIVKEGHPGDYFYVIEAGTAEVSKHGGSLSIELKKGQYFGDEALVSDSPRNATVTMKTSGILQRINAEDFACLIKQTVLKFVLPEELAALDRYHKILDVRIPLEFRMSHFPGSFNLPLSKIRGQLATLERNCCYLVADDAGARAHVAAFILCQAGYECAILQGAAPDERLSQAS